MTCVWSCFTSHICIVYTEAVQHCEHLEHKPTSTRSSWKCNSTSEYARSIQTTAWLTIEYDHFISFFFFFFCCGRLLLWPITYSLLLYCVWIQLHSYFLSSLDGLQVGFLSKQSTNTRVILREKYKSSITASPSHCIDVFLGFSIWFK